MFDTSFLCFPYFVICVQAIAAMDGLRESLRCFSGNRGEDISVWLKKIKLVAKIKKIDDIANLIPLYLEGPAFAVFDQMSARSKESGEAIEATLIAAFAQDKFGAYDLVRARMWSEGEPVDVFLSDIRRLADLAGIVSEQMVRCAFICGLPRDVSNQLRAAERINQEGLDVVVAQARILMSERIHGAYESAAVGISCTKKELVVGQGDTCKEDQVGGYNSLREKKITCYECGGNHPVRLCKRRNSRACWTCGGFGHLARQCKSVSGNCLEELSARIAPRRV